MIDLQKIEDQIDSVLADETSESLASWLMSKRNRSYSRLSGGGMFESMEYLQSSFHASSSVVVSTDAASMNDEVIDFYLSAA